MSDVQPITLANGTVLRSIADVQAAKASGQISPQDAKTYTAMFQKAQETEGKGTTVEKAPEGADDKERAIASADAQGKEVQLQDALKKLALARQNLAQADLNLENAPADKKAEAKTQRDLAYTKFKEAEARLKELQKNGIGVDDEDVEKPAPGSEKPAPGSEKPAPGSEKPAPGSEKPAPGSEKPAPGSEKPAPGSEKPAPGSEKPVPGSEKPAPGSAKPGAEDPELAKKVRKRDTIDAGGQTVRIINGEENRFAVTHNAPTKKSGREHTNDDEIKRMSRYYDEETGELITGTNALNKKRKEIKAKRDQAKKDITAAEKKRSAAIKELRSAAKAAKGGDAEAQERLRLADLNMDKAVNDLMAARERRAFFSEEYDQVNQAYKASQGNSFPIRSGIRGDRRAYNQNTRRYDKIANLTTVYLYDGEEKEAIKANPELKGHTDTASDNDFAVLADLYKMAKNQINKANTPQEKKAAEAIWNNFKDIFPMREDGLPDYTKCDPRKVQSAMMDLTGGDGKLDFTELEILKNELHLSGSQINHAFDTFGIETSSAFGKRLVNGLKVGVPMVGLSLLQYYMTKASHTETGHAERHGEAHSESHAYDSNTAIETAIAESTNKTTIMTPGRTESWTDADNILHERVIPGSTETFTETTRETIVAEAHANAQAHAYADVALDLSLDVAATAVAKLSPLGLWTAPALAFIGGFLKKPVESSAAIAGTTTEKMARYINVFKKNKNKNIGNQIIQYAEGRLTGNKALDEALVVAVLNNDIGIQNTVPTTRELRSALAHLDQLKEAIVAMQKEPPAPPQKPTEPPVEPPTEVPTEPPTEAPTETPCITKNVKVRTIPYGGPAQYADALGIPAKYRREFIEMFRQDNGLDRAGKISPHNPVIRLEYTFKDGTTVELGDEDAIKKKIDSAKSGKKGVTGKIRQKITAAGIACGTFTWGGKTYHPGDRVPQSVINEIQAQNK